LADTDPVAAKALIEEIGRDVQQATNEAAQLALQIYPPLLEGAGLAAALRSAAVNAGIRISVEVAAGATYPPEVAETVYLCCLDAIEHTGDATRTTVVVRDEGGAVAFEVAQDGARHARSDMALDRLHDRIEALGGRLTIRSERGRGTYISGSLPLAR
jgi:signal transduction histidine kinase